jgi:hypothetical protein
MFIKRLFLCVCVACAFPAAAQTQNLNLNDLSAFRPQAGNWQIVGDVVINPDLDIHEKAKPELHVPEVVKRGKKTKGVVAIQSTPQARNLHVRSGHSA